MIVHNFDPVLIDFGFFQIRWYSIAYILGILLGWIYAIKIIKKIQKGNYDFKSIKVSEFDDKGVVILIVSKDTCSDKLKFSPISSEFNK